jgi:hypothetical protein
MAAIHTATITEEGDEKILRLPAGVPLEAGEVTYEIRSTGELVLKQLSEEARARRQAVWIDFLDRIAARGPDTDFMNERPMNRIPFERDLWPDE